MKHLHKYQMSYFLITGCIKDNDSEYLTQILQQFSFVSHQFFIMKNIWLYIPMTVQLNGKRTDLCTAGNTQQFLLLQSEPYRRSWCLITYSLNCCCKLMSSMTGSGVCSFHSHQRSYTVTVKIYILKRIVCNIQKHSKNLKKFVCTLTVIFCTVKLYNTGDRR